MSAASSSSVANNGSIPASPDWLSNFSKGCGICEKPGKTEIRWPSPYSTSAHATCFNDIKPLEDKLLATINGLFKKFANVVELEGHYKAIEAVRKACGPDSIADYFVKKGPDALSKLFDTVGAEAAKKFRSTIRSKY